MKQDKKLKIFYALTSIHRQIKNNPSKISWSGEFKKQGIKSSTEIIAIKKALMYLNVVKCKGRTTAWNKEKTLPNIQLVDGIEYTIKKQGFNKYTKRIVQTTQKDNSKKENIIIPFYPMDRTTLSSTYGL